MNLPASACMIYFIPILFFSDDAEFSFERFNSIVDLQGVLGAF